MNMSRVKTWLIQIWPAIYRTINSVFYFLLNLVKNGVRDMVRQIKGEM